MEYIVQNVPFVAQATYETCWMAAYKMLLKWNGGAEILAETLPGDKLMRKDGIMDYQFLPCREALHLSSTTHRGLRTAEDIAAKLSFYGPIWVSGFYASGHKHIVVLRGVKGKGTDGEVMVNDPARGTAGAALKPDWWPLGWFINRLNPVDFACQHYLFSPAERKQRGLKELPGEY